MSLTLLKIVGSKKLKPSSPFPSPFPWRPLLLATGYTFFLMIRTFFNPISYKQTQHLPKYIPSLLSFSELPIMKELASQATYTFFISHSFFNSVILSLNSSETLLTQDTMPTQFRNFSSQALSHLTLLHLLNPSILKSIPPLPSATALFWFFPYH